MSETTDKSLRHSVAEAAEWFTNIREADLPAADRERFANWLSESPVHVREYLGVAQMWGLLSAAEAWPHMTAGELIDATRAAGNVTALPLPSSGTRLAAGGERAPSRRIAWAVAASVLLLIGAVGLLSLQPEIWRGGNRFSTVRGEQRSIVLPDGSVVDLNTLSAITVRFDDKHRRIELTEGEAFFRVARDAARPFEVVTPLAVVRAVGTEFNVYSRKRGTQVAVVEGHVQVSPQPDRAVAARSGSARDPAQPQAPVAKPIALGPEGSVEIEASGRILIGAPVNPQHAIAWIDRRLVFDNERVDRVIEEFNRYNARQLEIADADLGALRISGVFDANNPDALIEYLERVQSVRVSVEGGVAVLTKQSGQ